MRGLVFSLQCIFFILNLAMAQNFPALLVFDSHQNKSVALQLSKLAIDVKVTGNLATTTMDLTFFNPNNRQLEGQFYFPLGKGQTVSRFALDVNGHLREGVVVEKNRGQRIFEEVERRNIDPGLLEWTKGNNFKARIFPIPANGYKRVVLAYEQELKETEHGYLYLLPLQFQQRVEEFSIHVQVFKQTVAPQLTQNSLTNLTFKQWSESYIADFKAKNFLPNRQIGFTVPRDTNQQKVFVFNDTTRHTRFFYSHLLVNLKKQKRPLPQRITLLWDVSASANQRNITKELQTLAGYFAAIGNASIRLVTFAHEIIAEQSFILQNGNWQALQDTLVKLEYDGGTQLGVLDLNNYNCDEFILCSDGLSNFGSPNLRLGKAPVVVLNSSPNADHTYLQFVADSSKGRYLDLTAITVPQAVNLLLHQPLFFMGVKVKKGEVTELYPAMPMEVQWDFSLVGQLKSDEALVELHFGDGHKVFLKRFVRIQVDQAINNPIVRRVWAKKKLAQLAIQRERNEKQIVQLAKEFRLVTPFTSLLVLDRLEDYLRYRVVPPEKEMQKEYFARLQKQKENKSQMEKSFLERVVDTFQQWIEFWNMEFKGKEIDPERLEGIVGTIPTKSLSIDDLINGSENSEQEGNAILRELLRSQTETQTHSRQTEPSQGVYYQFPPSAEERMRAFERPSVGLEKSAASAGRSRRSVSTSGGIFLKKWDPDVPYLEALKKGEQARWYSIYMSYRSKYQNAPSFYFDVSDFFFSHGDTSLALRVLSNLAELMIENHELLRMLGYRLLQEGQYTLAEKTFRQVLKIRPEEPQSYRDLALTLAAEKQYQEAVELLWKVVKTQWDSRFPNIQLVALNELNNIIATCGKALDLSGIDKRLIKNLPVDIRIVLTWDADNTDIDLWVIDPDSEKCYYAHRNTKIGGRLSNDFTNGYGPEEFVLKKAVPGEYQIKAHYFGNHRQLLSGKVTVFVQIFTHYGTPQQTQKTLVFRLNNVREIFDIANVKF